MNKIDYKSLQLKMHSDTITFSILPGQEIEVLQYLPIEDKNDLIYVAIQKSEEENDYNLVKLHMFYNLYIVYMYTNIEFDEEDRADEVGLFNTLASQGIIDAVIRAIPEAELELLQDLFARTFKQKAAQKASVFSSLRSFLAELPKGVENAKEIIKDFKPEDFQQVIKFAEAANGGRPIN